MNPRFVIGLVLAAAGLLALPLITGSIPLALTLLSYLLLACAVVQFGVSAWFIERRKFELWRRAQDQLAAPHDK